MIFTNGTWFALGENGSAAKNTLEAQPRSRRAFIKWAGTTKVGEGRMTLIGEPGERINPDQD